MFCRSERMRSSKVPILLGLSSIFSTEGEMANGLFSFPSAAIDLPDLFFLNGVI